MNLGKPDQWSDSNLVPIPKSSNLRQVSNYKGISLSQIMIKVINRMVLNRIQPILDLLLQSNQNGFRPGRSTTAQILTLRRIIEAARNLPAVIKFIDFRKAFDSINRRKMLQILKAYGVPAQLVDAIGKTYGETWANVLSPDSENSSKQPQACYKETH